VIDGRQSDLAGYTAAIDADLRTHLWRMRQAARIVYAAPRITLRALSASASVRRLVTRAATESLR
jgi:hypothetical protein